MLYLATFTICIHGSYGISCHSQRVLWSFWFNTLILKGEGVIDAHWPPLKCLNYTKVDIFPLSFSKAEPLNVCDKFQNNALLFSSVRSESRCDMVVGSKISEPTSRSSLQGFAAKWKAENLVILRWFCRDSCCLGNGKHQDSVKNVSNTHPPCWIGGIILGRFPKF